MSLPSLRIRIWAWADTILTTAHVLPDVRKFRTSGSGCYQSPSFRWPRDQKKRGLWEREWPTSLLTFISVFIKLSLRTTTGTPDFHFPRVSPGDQTADQGAWGLWVRDWRESGSGASFLPRPLHFSSLARRSPHRLTEGLEQTSVTEVHTIASILYFRCGSKGSWEMLPWVKFLFSSPVLVCSAPYFFGQLSSSFISHATKRSPGETFRGNIFVEMQF